MIREYSIIVDYKHKNLKQKFQVFRNIHAEGYGVSNLCAEVVEHQHFRWYA
jgi:hypothetical protein